MGLPSFDIQSEISKIEWAGRTFRADGETYAAEMHERQIGHENGITHVPKHTTHRHFGLAKPAADEPHHTIDGSNRRTNAETKGN